MSAPQRNVANSFLVVRLFVNYEILADDDYAAWADIARDLNQHVRRLVDREYILADHMVQTKVHLVHRKSFLKVSSIDRTKVLIEVTIVNLEAGKLRVFDSNINADHR